MSNLPSFALFHVNVRSLSAHIDEMQALLTALKLRFDVIGVSEIKEQAGGLLKNLTLSGYVLHSQHASSSVGVALYAEEDLHIFMMRDDLTLNRPGFLQIGMAGGRADSSPLCNFCLSDPFDLKFGM